MIKKYYNGYREVNICDYDVDKIMIDTINKFQTFLRAKETI